MKVILFVLGFYHCLFPSCLSSDFFREVEGRSVLSTIFETLSSSASSEACPGRCFNAIAAMACRKVIDKPGVCQEPGYRCCKNMAQEEDSRTENPTTEEYMLPQKNDLEGESSPIRPPKLPSLQREEDRQPTRLESMMNNRETYLSAGETRINLDDEQPTDKADLIQYPPLSRVEVCPGVCVAKRISNFCEAAIDAEDLCKRDLRCCVPSNLFEGVRNVPAEFVLLNPPVKNGSANEMSQRRQDQKNLNEVRENIIEPITKMVSTERTFFESTTQRNYENKSYPEKEVDLSTPSAIIHPDKKCKGTCVAGFFSFLCDTVDRSGFCPRGGRCCISKGSKGGPNQRPKPHSKEETEDKYSFNSEHKKTTATTTKIFVSTTEASRPYSRPPPFSFSSMTSTELPHVLCTGTCLPVSLASRCKSPSKLIIASGCSYDAVCCDDRARKPVIPEANVPQTLGTLLSIFSAPNNDRPVTPRRPYTTTTTTTTTEPSTTTEFLDIPTCPGTCISPILSFTCFGNAEITDSFKCEKKKQSCCAPKSAIRDVNRQQEFDNIARNDTIYAAPINYNINHPPFASNQFESSHFPQNPYERPTIIQPPFHRAPEQNNLPPPYYRPPPPFHHSQYSPYPPQTQNVPQQPTYPQEIPQVSQPIYPQEVPQVPYQTEKSPVINHPPPQFDTKNIIESANQRPFYSSLPEHHEYNPEEIYNQNGTSHTFYTENDISDYQNVPEQSPNVTPAQSVHYYAETSTQAYQPSPVYKQEHNFRYTHATPSTNSSQQNQFTTPATTVNEIHLSSKYVCGVKGASGRRGRVVGGEDSVPGEWCWQVALINSLNQYLCGGALIGTQWVLTAAHCVTNIVRSGDAIYVRVGDHDLTTRLGSPGAQTIPVATTYIHHNHNSQTLDNDIALLKLSSSIELGNGVCLVCLPARGVSQVAGKRCIVTGYGYMGETGPIPLRIREAEIPVVSENECIRKINAVTEKVFILPASSFCAGGEQGHDACQGDGGGPLVCQVDNYYELSGLVSWGFGCGRQDVPGVYVKVSSFIGWINQIISVNNT